MSHRDGFLQWSLPVGTWFGTQVRISIWFPLLALVLCLRLEDWTLGLTVTGVLFVSVLLHEFGHVAGARMTGGSGHEILMWPLGGLAWVHPAATLSSQVLTTLAGPLVNLALCAITFWPVLESGRLADALNPLVLPISRLSADPLHDLLLLTFSLNWVLWLVNLIPVMPIDGGRMLRSVIAARMGSATATEFGIRVGMAVGVLAMFIGLLVSSALVVLVGAVIFIVNLQEQFQVRIGESYDDSFMGYDFSQGYTSLERSDERPREKRTTAWQRWRARRRAEKERRQQQQALEAERELDALLDKVHTNGLESLTDAERRQLARASARYREKGKPTE